MLISIGLDTIMMDQNENSETCGLLLNFIQMRS